MVYTLGIVEYIAPSSRTKVVSLTKHKLTRHHDAKQMKAYKKRKWECIQTVLALKRFAEPGNVIGSLAMLVIFNKRPPMLGWREEKVREREGVFEYPEIWTNNPYLRFAVVVIFFAITCGDQYPIRTRYINPDHKKTSHQLRRKNFKESLLDSKITCNDSNS